MNDTSSGLERRNDALRAAGKSRTEQVMAKAEKGNRLLLKDGGHFCFSSVVRASGVSAKFLHQNEELTERIRFLAAQQSGKEQRLLEQRELSRESAIVTALRRKLREQDEQHKKQVKELRKKIAELEKQNRVLYGKILKN